MATINKPVRPGAKNNIQNNNSNIQNNKADSNNIDFDDDIDFDDSDFNFNTESPSDNINDEEIDLDSFPEMQQAPMQQNLQQPPVNSKRKKEKQPKQKREPKQKKEKQPKPKKEPKQKKEKQPKQPKQPKQKKEKQSKKAHTQGKNQNRQSDNETKPKKSKKRVIIPIALLFIVAVAGFFLTTPKNKGVHFEVAVDMPEVSGDAVTEETEANNKTDDSIIKIDDYANVKVVVNTKLEGEDEYSDHDAYVKICNNGIVIGYDEVKEYLDKYNAENENNKINIGDKETFYSNVNNEAELVMYMLEFIVPDDFPTIDTEHGYIPIHPSIKISIKGTEEKDKIITQKKIYDIPNLYFAGDDISELEVGKEYKLYYVCTMPKGIDTSAYTIECSYVDADNNINNTYTIETEQVN